MPDVPSCAEWFIFLLLNLKNPNEIGDSIFLDLLIRF